MKKGILLALLLMSFLCFVSHGYFYLSYDQVVEIVKEANLEKMTIRVYGAVEKPVSFEIETGQYVGRLIEEAMILDEADIARMNDIDKIYESAAIYIPRIGEVCMFIESDLRFYPVEEVRNFSEEELMKIKGVGKTLAKRLYKFLQSSEFISFESLKSVEGIGEKKYALMMTSGRRFDE